MFSDDDIAALDSLVQAALPQLEVLRQQERHLRGMRKLFHEFHVPNNALRACLQIMQTIMRKTGPSPTELFGHDHLEDAWGYTDLLGRHLVNAMVFFDEARGGTHPKAEKAVALAKQVVEPALSAAQILLKDAGLRKDSIRVVGFKKLPSLHLDRGQWQSVLFNLLTNAIKHRGSADRFKVQIKAEKQSRRFVFTFTDWGTGILPEERDRIFEEGWRSEASVQRHVSGQGLGLTIVKQIVESHGGSINLRTAANPTCFEIILPLSLAKEPPNQNRSAQSSTNPNT